MTPGQSGFALGYGCSTPIIVDSIEDVDIESIINDRVIVILWDDKEETIKIPADKIQVSY